MKIDNNYNLNKVYTDEFGRVSGIFAVDKPMGKGSHDMVYEYRRKLGTKKVGHAGTLDPFASGLLIILAGKATKLSDKFLTLNKEYIAEIAFGITTSTLDPEGKIISDPTNLKFNFDDEEIKKTLNSFTPEYDQYVPIFSSVKVNGDKLRELARKYDRFEIVDRDNSKFAQFFKGEEIAKEIEIPKKNVKIYEIELLEAKIRDNFEDIYLNFYRELADLGIKELKTIKIRVLCSKGTYIRKLAEDIGEKLGTKAMLINLRRTKVGEISI